ncbi:hypothetical protein M9458_049845, partial [Cirrhinus mrigala]
MSRGSDEGRRSGRWRALHQNLLCRDAERFPKRVRDPAQRTDRQLLRGVRIQ